MTSVRKASNIKMVLILGLQFKVFLLLLEAEYSIKSVLSMLDICCAINFA